MVDGVGGVPANCNWAPSRDFQGPKTQIKTDEQLRGARKIRVSPQVVTTYTHLIVSAFVCDLSSFLGFYSRCTVLRTVIRYTVLSQALAWTSTPTPCPRWYPV